MTATITTEDFECRLPTIKDGETAKIIDIHSMVTHNSTYNIRTFDALFDVELSQSQLVSFVKHLDLGIEFMVAGGAVVRSLLNKDIAKADVDIYISDFTQSSFETKLEKVLKKVSDQHGVTFTESVNAYNAVIPFGIKKQKIQIMKNYFRHQGEILATFDMWNCQIGLNVSYPAYIPKEEKDNFLNRVTLTSNAYALSSLAKKKVMLNYVHNPLSTLKRVVKYKELGFEADDAMVALTGIIHRKASNIMVDSFKLLEAGSDVKSMDLDEALEIVRGS